MEQQPLFSPQLMMYWASSFVLAVLLFFPVRKIIFTIRVRGLQRRLKREATEEEQEKENQGAKFWAGLITVTFAFLFNRTFYNL